jgi:excisionase family DNA binding protein
VIDRVVAADEGFDALWNVNDVARFLKCSPSFIYKAAEAGRLPCLRIGRMLRFDPKEIVRFARGDEQNGVVLDLKTRRRA